MKKKFDVLLIVGVIILSIIVGFVFNDLIGGITLAFGFLSAYYSAVGKWFNYIFYMQLLANVIKSINII